MGIYDDLVAVGAMTPEAREHCEGWDRAEAQRIEREEAEELARFQLIADAFTVQARAFPEEAAAELRKLDADCITRAKGGN